MKNRITMITNLLRKKTLLFLMVSLIAAPSVFSQSTADFEGFDLDEESYWNGSDGSGGFTSGDIFFPNYWNEDFESWSGFAVSNITDNETPGYANQYSAFTGGGYDGEENYAVAYVSDPVTFENSFFFIPEGSEDGDILKEIVVTNNTYAATTIRDGDDFTDPFGGEDGDDPDWFLLTLVGWLDGEAKEDQAVEFYLADYRFDDNDENYIVDTWETLSLEETGPVDSLEIRLSSSDVGEYGMNTPAYVCIGRVTMMDEDDATAISDISREGKANMYPNPFRNEVTVSVSEAMQKETMHVRMYDAHGREVYTGEASNHQAIDLSGLRSGMYIVVFEGEEYRSSQRIIKQ